MTPNEHEKTISRLRTFFTTKFTSPLDPSQFAIDVREALEGSLLHHYIFTNNVVAIVDHSIHGFRYLSPQVKDVFGVDAEVIQEKGLDFTMSWWFPEDAKTMAPVFEKAASIMAGLSAEDRLCIRLNFDFRLNSPKGKIRVYQQTIPLAVNDAGFPYLLLEILSDVSEHRFDQGINYKMTLNLPGQPIKVLFAGGSNGEPTPLTEREKEIVQHMADGHDANKIAEKLFISEGTVRTHRKNILEKTGAKNSVHLVRMALVNGWV